MNIDMAILREWAEAKVSGKYFATDHDLPVARHILDAMPTATMADVEWDDSVHAGMCAESAVGGVVRMIVRDWLNDHADHILCYLRPGEFGSLPMCSLTPLPGTRVDLTPRREPEPESAPEPEQPLPEDVKPDPQPGEAWLIEYEGKRYEAIYWHSALYAHWSFVYNREGTVSIESHEATPVSRLVPERGDVS